MICQAFDWCRATLRYVAKVRPRAERLKTVLPTLTQGQPRFGQIRIRHVVCETVEYISKNAFHRLWQLLGLQVVPRKRRRSRRRYRLAQVPGLRATAPNQVWCLDFLKDYTSDGRGLRFLSIVDEHPRLCVGLEVERRFRAAEVVAVLDRLVALRGAPTYLRSDNGPEFVATVVERWAKARGIQLVRSAPRHPWENPFIESFHSRLRDEFVEREVFGSLAETKILAEAYRRWYNEARPHSALKYLTPRAFLDKLLARVTGQPGCAGNLA